MRQPTRGCVSLVMMMRHPNLTARALGLAAVFAASGCYSGMGDIGPDGAGQEGGAPDTGEGESDDADDDDDGGGDDGVGAQCGETAVARRAPIRRMTDVQYRNTIADLFDGLIDPSAAFPETLHSTPYTSFPEANLVSQLGAENIMAAAEEAAAQAVENLEAVVPCASGADQSSCADTFIESLARRAFRRAVRDDERALLRGVFDGATAETDFPDAIGRVIATTLQMPQFLYLVEEGEPTDDPDVVRLSSSEVASRLSYLFWDTMPDTELFDAADADALQSVAEIEMQARRLLADPRALPVIARFSRQWLGVSDLSPATKDAATFPQFDETLAAAMEEEFDRFVREAYRSGQGSLQQLLVGESTVVNAPLAALYGVDSGSTGPDDWRAVTLDPTRRKGVLTLPAVMAANAGSASTSSIFRGKMLRTQALCQDLPPPPADLEIPDFPDSMSEREKSAVLLDNASCSGCHVLMNPLGLAFEHYDAIGAWRDADANGEIIDDSGEIVDGRGGLDATFRGGPAFADLVAESEASASCMTLQWMRYTYGRRETPDDQCVADALTERLTESGDDLQELLVAFTQTEGFRFRRVEAQQ
ncbi:MAG: DUF1592 domain-containing protein [Nannocystaceae bacterium]|nr:DUF1592 domain-containing protein [Nannocystaceae bacterium]